MDDTSYGYDEVPTISFQTVSVPVSVIESKLQNQANYANFDSDFNWTRNSARHLIQLVSDNFEKFYDKAVKKKVLWRKIAQKMRSSSYFCSGDDCDKKWRNLKKTYVGILQKQVKGDFTSKFPYFEEMHSILGKEIDPLGMREQGLDKAIREKSILDSKETERVSYYEITQDDSFEWSLPAVYLLLDLIIEHRELFITTNLDVDNIWESIMDRLIANGYEGLKSDQCQRKWQNLSEGFKYYQNKSEISGSIPTWPYFSKVREVLNTVNVPVTLVNDAGCSMKGSLFSPVIQSSPSKKRKTSSNFVKEEIESSTTNQDSNPDSPGEPQSLMKSFEYFEKTLEVNKRLAHLETKVEIAHKQKAAAKHTNSLLALILGELKSINKNLEDKKTSVNKDTIGLSNINSLGEIQMDMDCSNLITLNDMPKFKVMKRDSAPEGMSSDDGIIIVEGL